MCGTWLARSVRGKLLGVGRGHTHTGGSRSQAPVHSPLDVCKRMQETHCADEYGVAYSPMKKSHPSIRRTQTSTLILWYWVKPHTLVCETPLVLMPVFRTKGASFFGWIR